MIRRLFFTAGVLALAALFAPPLAPEPAAVRALGDGGLPPTVAFVYYSTLLAGQEPQAQAHVRLAQWAEVVWPTTCLLDEVPRIEVRAPIHLSCFERPTPGYRLLVAVGERGFEIRTDATGSQFTALRPGGGPGFAAQPPAEQVRRLLAGELYLLNPQLLEPVSLAEASWPTGCLGLAPRWNDDQCGYRDGGPASGYRAVFRWRGHEYGIRWVSQSRHYRVEWPAIERLSEPVLVWQSGAGREAGASASLVCGRLELGASGDAAAGECGGQLALHSLDLLSRRSRELEVFLETYAPFSLELAGGGRLMFTGRGNRPATEAERERLAEWSALVWSEVTFTARLSADLLMYWSWQGAGSVRWMSVTVYGTGFYEIGPPEGGRLLMHWPRLLTGEQLATLQAIAGSCASWSAQLPGTSYEAERRLIGPILSSQYDPHEAYGLGLCLATTVKPDRAQLARYREFAAALATRPER